jgi:hypothetical protein
MKTHELIAGLTLGEPVFFGGLQVSPILKSEGGVRMEFDLFEAALLAEQVEVTEISDDGSVRELRLLNSGARPVLLIDGEELVGAKQNRVLNVTVLAPPARETLIPVSCVEQGRWGYRSDRFSAGKQALFSQARARKSFRMSDFKEGGFADRADQHAIWGDVSSKLRALKSSSATSAMSDGFADREADLAAFEERFRVLPNQVGAIFVLNGRGAGIEVVSRPEAFAGVFFKILRSYAIDALEAPAWGDASAAGAVAADFMAALSASLASQTAGVGLGEALTLRGDGLSGSALTHQGELIHMAAFEEALAA